MPPGLATTMLSTVALSLASIGALGVGLAAWQLAAWTLLGSLPPLAESWRAAGVTGELLTAFFQRLPLLLMVAIVFHAWLAWLGLGLLWRRPWARRATLGFGFAWAALAAGGYALAHYALGDLARGYAEYRHFAAVAESLVGQVALVNVALAAALVLLLIQPAVRAQFRSGS
ncbi:MAG: hypothetical protein JSR73_14670 [Proteobacteria bacterium]|nr:hypothetical protein [Pseudomonadota bacterium]